MTDSKAMMAMFDAFDNANQGLAIWDEGDNLIGFNSIYRDIFKNNIHKFKMPNFLRYNYKRLTN